jgi:ABC-type transport system involved in cytochrome bd biosynthesis fused ATPase/permease subunit
MTPRLLAERRLRAGLGLGVIALTQAALAAGFATQIGLLGGASGGTTALVTPLMLLLGSGLALIAERRVGEAFAQSFVTDCRAALFDSVIRRRGAGGEARWLTGLVADMTAIRNYAVRGSVKLFTASLACGGALLWLVVAHPAFRVATLPLFAAMLLVIPLASILTDAIAEQRLERGRLNRFVIRRVRIEADGLPSPNGHGRKKLRSLSEGLGALATRRALLVGIMEAIVLIGGMAAGMIVILAAACCSAGHGGDGSALAGFAIIGFAATRLLEAVRALHARIGGTIALERLDQMVRRPARPPQGDQEFPQ